MSRIRICFGVALGLACLAPDLAFGQNAGLAPNFKGTTFAGRKGKSERAVFMELFTGAACPPCVAADLAFDVLMKTYKPSELVLVQYHMHIPGPDPMTNPDSIARWNYYGKAHPGKVRGVPCSLFDGAVAGAGGGGAANAEKKYDAYRNIIDPLLEQREFARISAQAAQKGNKVHIDIQVTGLVGADSSKKLRVLLAEETVRYLGPNKIGLHHNVVRAMPSGAEGKALIAAASKHSFSVDLDQLKSQLSKYLDDFEAKGRKFSNPNRPLDLNKLRVVAFVQDDANANILQAVQVNVENGKK